MVPWYFFPPLPESQNFPHVIAAVRNICLCLVLVCKHFLSSLSSAQVTDFFSYEHFYVIYCKFWELDTDHNLEIDCQDLSRHADQGEWKHLISSSPKKIAELSSMVAELGGTPTAISLVSIFFLPLCSSHSKDRQPSHVGSGVQVSYFKNAARRSVSCGL